MASTSHFVRGQVSKMSYLKCHFYETCRSSNYWFIRSKFAFIVFLLSLLCTVKVQAHPSELHHHPQSQCSHQHPKPEEVILFVVIKLFTLLSQNYIHVCLSLRCEQLCHMLAVFLCRNAQHSSEIGRGRISRSRKRHYPVIFIRVFMKITAKLIQMSRYWKMMFLNFPWGLKMSS